jgi:hypothetical protein
MTNSSFEESLDQYVPNYRRFQEALDPESDIIVDLTILLKKVFDAWLLESIWKYINLELGLCVLKDKEIDEKKLKEVFSVLKR